jgi:hypothetical protein
MIFFLNTSLQSSFKVIRYLRIPFLCKAADITKSSLFEQESIENPIDLIKII